MNKQKKSQAAMEFLMTYAWAFLIILVVIAAITYFGILRPNRLLPDRCNFGPEVSCLDFQVQDAPDNTFRLRLKNNIDEAITVTGMSLSSESSTQYSCTSPANPTNWVSGGIVDLTFTSCNTAAAGFIAGEKAKVAIKITYYGITSGSSYTHDVQGEVFTTVS